MVRKFFCSPWNVRSRTRGCHLCPICVSPGWSGGDTERLQLSWTHQGKGDQGLFGRCSHAPEHPENLQGSKCPERGKPSLFLLWSMARSLCLCRKATGGGNKFDFISGLQDQRVTHPACLCATSFSVLRKWEKKNVSFLCWETEKESLVQGNQGKGRFTHFIKAWCLQLLLFCAPCTSLKNPPCEGELLSGRARLIRIQEYPSLPWPWARAAHAELWQGNKLN